MVPVIPEKQILTTHLEEERENWMFWFCRFQCLPVLCQTAYIGRL